MENKLHIISFQVPFPPNYGGVIDVFYKLKSLKDLGYYLILHTYQYKRSKYEKEILSVVDEVYYYQRDTHWLAQLSVLPYIVNSRKAPQLLIDLLKDEAPILFEGLHTCYLLNHPILQKRIKVVRMHNVEHEYYKQLQFSSHSPWKKVFFCIESYRLKKFEKQLNFANYIACITEKDKKYFETVFSNVKSILLPCFFQQNESPKKVDTKNYILYHGNLAVEENIKAVIYILRYIVPRLSNISFIIAGNNPDATILKEANKLTKVDVIASPSQEYLNKLIIEAKINLLLTFQSTGIKLKLLNALYIGGHCIANTPMILGTGIEELCKIADDPEKLVKLIEITLKEDFTTKDKEDRILFLNKLYSNKKNSKVLDALFKNNILL